MIPIYLLVMLISLPMITAFALEEEISDSKVLEAKIDTLQGQLIDHNGESTVQFLYSLNIALLALAISLIISGLAAWQATKNTRETHEFITKNSYLQDANNYFNRNDFKNAKKYYDLYLEFEPNNIKQLVNVGACTQQLNNNTEAITYYEKILKLEPENTAALNNLGTCFKSLGNLPKCLEYYEQSLKINPNHADTLNNIGTLYYDSLTKTYDTNLKNANFEKAILYFDQIINQKLLSGNDLIQILLNKANALSQSGKIPDSINICNDILGIDSSNVSALLIKGLGLMRIPLYSQALICFDIILKKEPLNDKALLNKGSCHLELNQPKDALKCYNEFVIKNPNDFRGYLNIGNIFAKLKDHEHAIPHYESGVQVAPKNLDLLLNLSASYMVLNNPEPAKKYLLRAFEENPNDIDILTNLGACFLMLEELPHSLYYLISGFRINPTHNIVLKNLAGLFKILKDDEALSLISQIQKILMNLHKESVEDIK